MSKRSGLAVTLLVVILGHTSAVRSEPGVSYEFIVVQTTNSAVRIGDDNGFYSFPWHRVPGERADIDLGPDEILVSNGCGFAVYEYQAVTLEQFQRLEGSDSGPAGSIVAKGRIGEWCRISTHIYELETLLVTRAWNDDVYIVDSAEVFFDDAGDAYLIDTHFIRDWELGEHLVPIPNAGDQEGCWEAEGLPADWQRDLEREGYSHFGEYICATTAVYLRDIDADRVL